MVSQNETIRQFFQDFQAYHKAQTDFLKIQTELAVLKKRKVEMELEYVMSQSQAIVIDHTDEPKAVQNKPVGRTLLFGLKQRVRISLIMNKMKVLDTRHPLFYIILYLDCLYNTSYCSYCIFHILRHPNKKYTILAPGLQDNNYRAYSNYQ